MPQFSYKARSSSGAMVESVIDAPDQRLAMDKLKNQKFIVTDIRELKSNALLDFLSKLNPLKPSVSAKELVLFSRQFSTLVNAGVPIVQGLTILVNQAETPVFKKVINPS